MSATEDESQSLDAGWDDEAPSAPGEDDVDSAWDSLPPPVSGTALSLGASQPVAAEEVDSGWDDLPEGSLVASGKRRPHRPRRTTTQAPMKAANPVLLPRPAEPTKKQQREHARKQRAYEAQIKQQRKDERKAQRIAQAREEAAARLRQTEAEEQARRERREARARADREQRAAKPVAPKRAVQPAVSSFPEVKGQAEVAHTRLPNAGMRKGVIIALLVVAAIVALLVLRK